MSTILDALRRARSEDPENRYAGSRVFADPMPQGLQRRRAWVLPAVITTGLLVLLLLAGGSIYYVLRVMPQVGAARTQAALLPVPPAAGAPASASPAPGLATPAPVSPSAAAPTAAAQAQGTQPAQTATPGAATDLPTPVPVNQVKLDPVTLSTPPNAPEAGSQPAPSNAFRLGTIVWDENRPLAIINDDSVREGDVRDDFTVIDITPNSVTIRTRDGQDVVLKGE